MRVLKPGQKVTLHDDGIAAPIEGRIRCMMLYDDMSVLYECRWWADGEPDCANFTRSELTVEEPEYIEVAQC